MLVKCAAQSEHLVSVTDGCCCYHSSSSSAVAVTYWKRKVGKGGKWGTQRTNHRVVEARQPGRPTVGAKEKSQEVSGDENKTIS